jgi:hypothetical protein
MRLNRDRAEAVPAAVAVAVEAVAMVAEAVPAAVEAVAVVVVAEAVPAVVATDNQYCQDI